MRKEMNSFSILETPFRRNKMGKKVRLEVKMMKTYFKDIELPEGKTIDDIEVTNTCLYDGMNGKTEQVYVIPNDSDVPDWIKIDLDDFDSFNYKKIGYAFVINQCQKNELRVEDNLYSLNYLGDEPIERVYKRCNFKKGCYETIEKPNNSQFD